jgi:pyridoxamine 5'-phosphate oxidase-like protein
MAMNNNHLSIERHDQIERARRLLNTVRHAAYATVNEDGTPHNSPLMFIPNEDLTRLYVGSYCESLHSKNLVRDGRAFVVLFDSFMKGQGGVYITGMHAHECQGDELVEALRVHNAVRARYGSDPIDIAYYQTQKPAQRMYSIDVVTIEVYNVVRGDDGLIVSEARVGIEANDLLKIV